MIGQPKPGQTMPVVSVDKLGVDSSQILLCLWYESVHADTYDGLLDWIFFGDFNIMLDITFWAFAFGMIFLI